MPYRYAMLLPLILTSLACDQTNRDLISPIDLSQENTEPLPVLTLPLEETSSEVRQRDYLGTVIPQNVGNLSFTISGRILDIPVTVGERVVAGTALAYLDVDQYTSKKNTLESSLADTKDELSLLYSLQEDIDQEGMTAVIQSLQAQLDQLKQDIASSFPDDNPPSNLNDRLRNTQKQIQNVDQQQRTQRINALNNQIQNISGQIEEVEQQIKQGVLTAPFEGVISDINSEKGAVISPGRPLIRLIDPSSLQVHVRVPSRQISNMNQVEEIVISPDTESARGIISTVSPEQDAASITREIILDIEDSSSPATTWIPGERVHVLFRSRLKSGYWIPLESLTRQADGLWSIFIVDQDNSEPTVARIYVRILDQENDQVLIESDLKATDLLIVDGLHRIVPGQKVEVLTEPYDEQPRIIEADGVQ